MLMVPKGRTPEEVLRAIADPADLAALDVYAEYSARPLIWFFEDPPFSEIMYGKWAALHAPLERAVIERPKAGTLVATALELPLTGRSRREAIAPELWDELNLFFDKAEAQGRGLHLVQVGILTSQELDQSSSGAPPPTVLDVACGEPGLSDDGCFLSLRDQRFVLRGEIQQEIMRQLIAARREGKRLRTADVLRHAGSNCDTISKAFSGSPHWDTLKTILISRNGHSWIEP